jgi:hypothetical protein
MLSRCSFKAECERRTIGKLRVAACAISAPVVREPSAVALINRPALLLLASLFTLFKKTLDSYFR